MRSQRNTHGSTDATLTSCDTATLTRLWTGDGPTDRHTWGLTVTCDCCQKVNVHGGGTRWPDPPALGWREGDCGHSYTITDPARLCQAVA